VGRRPREADGVAGLEYVTSATQVDIHAARQHEQEVLAVMLLRVARRVIRREVQPGGLEQSLVIGVSISCTLPDPDYRRARSALRTTGEFCGASSARPSSTRRGSPRSAAASSSACRAVKPS
jgi:hypothetical protein